MCKMFGILFSPSSASWSGLPECIRFGCGLVCRKVLTGSDRWALQPGTHYTSEHLFSLAFKLEISLFLAECFPELALDKSTLHVSLYFIGWREVRGVWSWVRHLILASHSRTRLVFLHVHSKSCLSYVTADRSLMSTYSGRHSVNHSHSIFAGLNSRCWIICAAPSVERWHLKSLHQRLSPKSMLSSVVRKPQNTQYSCRLLQPFTGTLILLPS